MKKRYLALFVSLTMFAAAGCQKGETAVEAVPDIADLHIRNYDFNQLELLSNGQPAFARNTSSFKVLSGKNTLALVNRETRDTLFEQEFDIQKKDTLYLLLPSAQMASLLRSNQGGEPQPGKDSIKVKIMNFTSLLPEGQPVNLEFRQAIGYDWDSGGDIYSDKTDTIFNVTASTETYVTLAALEIPDYSSFGGFRVTFLDANNQPILKDGFPVYITFAAEGYLAENGTFINAARIYTSYLTDNDIYLLETQWAGQFVNLFLN